MLTMSRPYDIAGFSGSAQARPHSRCAGFTYLGLLFLIAMMGFALTVVSEMWHTVQQREKESELLFVGDQFRRAIGLYNAGAAGYPHRLEDLLKDPRFPDVRRYLRKVYSDPMTGRPEWGLVKGDGDAIIGVHSLSEAEPLKKKGFSKLDNSFEGKSKYSEWVFAARAGQAAAITPVPASPTQPGAAPQPSATPSVTPSVIRR